MIVLNVYKEAVSSKKMIRFPSDSLTFLFPFLFGEGEGGGWGQNLFYSVV